MLASPAIDVTEKGNKYIIEADLPGVAKDNLQVRVGDGNQRISIEGKVAEKGETKSDISDANSSPEFTNASRSTSVTDTGESATHISVERPLGRNYSFTRTVWLPRPVDPNDVVAKLQNGVLSISLNQVPDEPGKVVEIEEV